MNESYVPWWWKLGKPADLWVTYRDIVEDTIKGEKISPLGAEHYPTIGLYQQTYASRAQLDMGAPADQKILEKIKPDFPGGLKSPHLHFKRDVYLLDSAQWKIFSTKVISRFKEKISGIGTVGFNHLVETSEALSNLV